MHLSDTHTKTAEFALKCVPHMQLAGALVLLLNICGAVVLSIALLRQGFPSVSFAGGIDIVLTLVLSESTTRDQRQQQQQQS